MKSVETAVFSTKQYVPCKTETGIRKDNKGMLITQNYINVHNGHCHSVSWEKDHK